MRTALTIGTFDTPHLGHALLFKECERYAERVVVGVNSDEFVESYKGRRPLFEYEKRAGLIATLGYEVLKNSSAGRELIEYVKPNILVIGSDWAKKDYYAQIDVNQDFMDAHNITMVYVPRSDISSTEIKARSQNEEMRRALRNHHYGA